MPKIAVVGAGSWGQNHVRTFYQLESLYSVCDTSHKQLAKLKKHFHGVRFTDSYDEVLEDGQVDGIVIAAPAVKHFEIAKRSIDRGKATFIEKPMTLDPADAQELVKMAAGKKVPLMVGHLLRYHPAVIKIKDMIDKGELGEVHYLYSQRVNLGTIRQDENALWSFAPHDISVALYLLGDHVSNVSARGECYLQKDIEDVVFLNIQYSDNKMANIQLSWLDPYKERKLTIVGSRKMVAFDDMQAQEKVKIYDKGVTKNPDYDTYGDYLMLRMGDIHIPKIDMTEPLKLECQHFLECIKEGKHPRTDGKEGVRVVQILEAAQRSLDKNGAPVEVNL